jgi:hypothetical protein
MFKRVKELERVANCEEGDEQGRSDFPPPCAATPVANCVPGMWAAGAVRRVAHLRSGAMTFITLRDRYGVIQVAVDSDSPQLPCIANDLR